MTQSGRIQNIEYFKIQPKHAKNIHKYNYLQKISQINLNFIIFYLELN